MSGSKEATSSPTIAINSQISVESPGGTETNLLSLIKAVGRLETSERFLLLGHRDHSHSLHAFAGGNETVTAWPFDQVGYASPSGRPPVDEHARQAIVSTGLLAPLILPAYRLLATGARLYRTARFGRRRNPSAKEADALLRRRGVSAVHFPYPLYFDTTLPFVYEPWDLQHRHYPEFFSPGEWTWRDRLYREGCERARLVITATRWVKQDIVTQYRIPACRVAAIPRGSLVIAEPLRPAERLAAWRQHSIPDHYAFYPAMTFPHKNHLRLLQALSRLRDEQDIRLPLVCSGRVFAPHWPRIEAEINRLGLRDQVLFLGVVSDAMLASLYRHARFVVFPSLFEGLGLPLLEAMHHGVPILASRATCIPEVAGEVAVLFDGERVEAIVGALIEALRHPDALRARISCGQEILRRYSWGKAARTFIACYRFAAGHPLSEEQRALVTEATET